MRLGRQTIDKKYNYIDKEGKQQECIVSLYEGVGGNQVCVQNSPENKRLKCYYQNDLFFGKSDEDDLYYSERDGGGYFTVFSRERPYRPYDNEIKRITFIFPSKDQFKADSNKYYQERMENSLQKDRSTKMNSGFESGNDMLDGNIDGNGHFSVVYDGDISSITFSGVNIDKEECFLMKNKEIYTDFNSSVLDLIYNVPMTALALPYEYYLDNNMLSKIQITIMEGLENKRQKAEKLGTDNFDIKNVREFVDLFMLRVQKAKEIEKEIIAAEIDRAFQEHNEEIRKEKIKEEDKILSELENDKAEELRLKEQAEKEINEYMRNEEMKDIFKKLTINTEPKQKGE